MNKLRRWFQRNGTKVLGFAQVTVGAITAYPALFPGHWMPFILALSGVLTAWRGFVNDQNGNPP